LNKFDLLKYVEPDLIRQHKSHITEHGYNLKRELCGTNFNDAYGIRDGRFGPRTDAKKQHMSEIAKKMFKDCPELHKRMSEQMKTYYANGGNPPMKGKKHRPESIQKMSESTKAMVTDKQREQMSQMSLQQWNDPIKREKILNRIRNMSKETRQKMSIAKIGKTTWNKGKKHRPESIEKMRVIKLGKTMSDEARRKNSETHKANMTLERRLAVAEKSLGHKLTTEAKQKIGNATRKYSYRAVAPDGTEQTILSLADYCKEHNINEFTARVAAKDHRYTKSGFFFEQA
jgi:hypothetical protein